ncbi:amidophosphoribosyltransferase [Candidatus Daviesbacteria bacterium]|nr:amidophosphoribosyltransferase [Candidatus Daviesbacteria bacterium]
MLLMPRPGEKCGIFGVFGEGFESARLTYLGLWSLQHRGQESSGIATSNGKKIKVHKKQGLVAHVYNENDIEKLKGHISIGHNRYSTSGGSTLKHNQPVIQKGGKFALSHNGNLPSVKKLERFLKSKKIDVTGLNDSEMMFEAINYYLQKDFSIEKAISKSYQLFTGVFCFLVLAKDKLIAVRDRYGIRPLSLGALNGGGFVVASETCALDTVNATFLREVNPGEMLIMDESGLKSIQIVKGTQKLDIFEFVYFARPDSKILGKNVYKVRENFGYELASESPVDADLVIPIPDSAIPAGVGYSAKSGIPLSLALVKNRYIHRTFIRPEQHLRKRDVQLKLNPIREILQGKSVILIDDSIVRGNTIGGIVKILKNAGASHVHVRVSSPEVKYPDFYGIDTPTQKELIAANLSLDQIKEQIGADSISFLSYEGMIKATGLPEKHFSTSCFSGVYPSDIGEKKKEIVNIPPSKPLQIPLKILSSN